MSGREESLVGVQERILRFQLGGRGGDVGDVCLVWAILEVENFVRT